MKKPVYHVCFNSGYGVGCWSRYLPKEVVFPDYDVFFRPKPSKRVDKGTSAEEKENYDLLIETRLATSFELPWAEKDPSHSEIKADYRLTIPRMTKDCVSGSKALHSVLLQNLPYDKRLIPLRQFEIPAKILLKPTAGARSLGIIYVDTTRLNPSDVLDILKSIADNHSGQTDTGGKLRQKNERILNAILKKSDEYEGAFKYCAGKINGTENWRNIIETMDYVAVPYLDDVVEEYRTIVVTGNEVVSLQARERNEGHWLKFPNGKFIQPQIKFDKSFVHYETFNNILKSIDLKFSSVDFYVRQNGEVGIFEHSTDIGCALVDEWTRQDIYRRFIQHALEMTVLRWDRNE